MIHPMKVYFACQSIEAACTLVILSINSLENASHVQVHISHHDFVNGYSIFKVSRGKVQDVDYPALVPCLKLASWSG